MVAGLLHPGEMGAAIGGQLRVPVLWASEGRSEETARRAAAFEDVETVEEVARRSEVIFSICPPHAAREVARSVAGFGGIYVDANAVAPATVREIAEGHVIRQARRGYKLKERLLRPANVIVSKGKSTAQK